MNKNNSSMDNLIKLVQNVFLGEKNELVDIDVNKICSYAKFHSLEYIIYTGLNNYGIEVDEKFKKASELNAYKSITQELELCEIIKVLSSKKICFMPLKGAVLQKIYPKIEYRNMADVDILVKIDDLKNAGSALKEIGYVTDTLGGNHDTYTKKPYMHIEVHRALIDEYYEKLNAYFADIWNSNRIYHLDNDYHYYLRDEDFYIFFICHASKHFSNGGTGFRTIIDVYIYLKEKKETLDLVYIDQELEKIGLLMFNNIIKDSVDYVFYHIKKDNIDDVLEFLAYVIDSGTYGSTSNSATIGVIDDGGSGKYIIKRLFPPFSSMKRRNPILKKIPILLPWFYFTRLLKGLFHIKIHKRQYDNAKNVNESDIARIKRIQEITGVE